VCNRIIYTHLQWQFSVSVTSKWDDAMRLRNKFWKENWTRLNHVYARLRALELAVVNFRIRGIILMDFFHRLKTKFKRWKSQRFKDWLCLRHQVKNWGFSGVSYQTTNWVKWGPSGVQTCPLEFPSLRESKRSIPLCWKAGSNPHHYVPLL
jgi:hypothetical protein